MDQHCVADMVGKQDLTSRGHLTLGRMEIPVQDSRASWQVQGAGGNPNVGLHDEKSNTTRQVTESHTCRARK